MRLTFICNTTPKKALYQCSCGNQKELYKCNVREGKTESCGCLRSERSSERFTKHGHSAGYEKTRTYCIWKLMRSRCNSPTNQNYEEYGGRGITICERWNDFANFLVDMGECPSTSHSIDRIDNEGNYCPENCRWATFKEQNNNKRNIPFYEAFGEKKTLTAWAEQYGVLPATLRMRLKVGLSMEEALTKPLNAKKWNVGEAVAHQQELLKSVESPFDTFCPCI